MVPSSKSYHLEDLCTVKTGKLNSNEAAENGQYPFFTCSKEISRINNYAYDCEAILLPGNGDLGTVFYYNGKFNAYQRTYIITLKPEMKEYVFMPYLYHYLQEVIDDLLHQSTGSIIKYFKIGMLTSIKICLPSFDEQKKITQDLSKFTDLIEAIDAEKALRIKQYHYYRHRLLR